MRILSVRLHNLNSLAGSWSIDFSAPGYVASGIFAITGPTGAGKSTILDAICLALYGRTPRLRQVSRSQNEIMSRRTGECAAEVEFETGQGRFRCHWSQHRARRRPDGQLQQPRHELADGVTGELLATRIREVEQKVEGLTGMDFDRFTRSMLLAQGDFAAFLRAGPDERAPILEQITGTGIYSRISILVHERCSAERIRLAELVTGLDGLQALAPEQVASLRSGLERLRARAGTLDRVLQRLSRALAWWERVTELREQLHRTRLDLEQAARHRQDARPQLERLARAMRAATLDSLYVELCLLRQEQERDGSVLVREGEKEERLAGKRQELAASFGAAEQALQECRRQRQRGEEVIRRVRDLDVRLAAAGRELARRRATLAGREEECGRQEADLAAGTERITVCLDRLAELVAYCEEHSRDGLLVEQLAGIRGRCARLEELARTRTGLEQQEAAAAEGLARAEQELARQEQVYRESEQAVPVLEQRRAGLEERRNRLLQGRSLAAWQEQGEALARRVHDLEEAGRALARIGELTAALDTETRNSNRLQAALDACRSARARLEEELALRRKLVNGLREQEELRRRIRDLEEERGRLVPGRPCPLCGSTSHPWAEETPQVAEPDALAREEAAFDELAAAVGRDAVRQATLEQDLVRVGERCDEFREALARERQRLARLAAELEVEPDRETLERVMEEAGRQRQEGRRILARAGELQQEIEDAGRALEQAREDRSRAGQGLQEARYRRQAAADNLNRVRQELAGVAENLEEARQELGRCLQPLGMAGPLPADPGPLLRELEQRLRVWKKARQEQDLLQRDLAGLRAGQEAGKKRLRQLRAENETLQQEIAAREEELKQLQEERQELFGSRDPDREQERLAATEEKATARLEELRSGLAGADRDLHALRERLRRLRQDIGVRAGRLRDREERLRQALASAGFRDEAEFTDARLQPAEMQALQELETSLQQEEAGLRARAGELAATLAAEEEKALSATPLPELLQRQESLQGRRRELQERIGALRAELEREHAVEQRRRELIGALRAQERETARWERLHELIGSADGRKFRVFAQGLTLDLVIHHANRELQKMQDRYLLVRAGQSLDLAVIDNYQAGEIRSTANLSGGESFLVSLALSLGLSAMASRNVRVDSLFLDEGFGTLDEDALDMALQTLAGLRREGKLIGIISHVPALRERIPTRIRVEPGPGGRSRITGPGVAGYGSRLRPGRKPRTSP